jgi:hypothetical protein
VNNQTDFSSRIGLRAVGAGVLVSFTCMVLLLSLIAALGMFNFYLDEMAGAGPSFWISVSVAWAISLFAGGFVSSLACRPQTKTEGILNALASNCGFFLMFGVVALFLAPRVIVSLFTMATPQLFLRGFIVDVICFIVGAYGGIFAVQFEKHAIHPFHHGHNNRHNNNSNNNRRHPLAAT